MIDERETALKCGTGALVLNADLESLARRNNLLDFESVMAAAGGEVVKHAVPERKTVRMCLGQAGDGVEVYLKRTYPQPTLKFLGQLLKMSRPKTAFDEFKNIAAFHRAGIPTVTPVAAGVRRRGILRQAESFLISLSLTGCRRLDHFFSETDRLPVPRKKKIIESVARLVRKMHACGFNHRDLYLCHILRSSRGEHFVVDLHRVDRHETVPERWRVKDIAALNYSAPAEVFSRTDRLRFLKIYCGVDKLTRREKRLAGKVLKKTARVQRHNAEKQ